MGNRREFLATTAAGLAAAAAAPARAAEERNAAPKTTPAGAPAVGMPRDMVLLNMRRGDGYALGVKTEDGVLDVAAAGRALGMPVPADMDDLLQNGRGPALRALIDAVEAAPDGRFVLAGSGIAYAPVVTRPEKIIMMGFNYRHHAEETGTPIPKDPPLFNKYNNALNHHGGTIALPTQAAREFDYETELVMVFGRECRNVSEADALDYLAGYCTGNDFSARDLQTLTSQFMIGKTSDGFAPLGPYLVTADRVKDPNNLKLKTLVNGQVRQDWNTSDMIFNCRQLISFASKMMTIRPGDIFYTGTPQGVIFGEKIPRKDRAWLKPGDEIVSELEGLGELRFRLV
ncbi:2-keto-4-pentenoate hydratase/2-oxohepta-3-ene-1,7-dioic acid hydratase (catechol pathway) [Methylobacterium sp. UNC378MF]|uniref:fumarylacetoacetate hydrolase family protein n=1 Tax=Methylobacterium sp. UNC378MF TaxID=1502748 RepID=UPI00088F54AD|nr:fumarylacetoacetate hydrolase family protein [Methylobacterium sp. UNC378MF]SDA10998.1 2-keto-4-pentenoate hydratase/2-oxohepta-3-ene-1,7-dioic acid hydratase (catechol pathway) [Methylobacterium sp. UNC378MF]